MNAQFALLTYFISRVDFSFQNGFRADFCQNKIWMNSKVGTENLQNDFLFLEFHLFPVAI